MQSSDQHTVKPWFNGRLDVAPPVVDLTAQEFTLLGGRLHYINGRAVAAIVYRRRVHVINLFVTQGAGPDRAATMGTVQGFNIWLSNQQGLNFWAVSDINADELQEFRESFRLRSTPITEPDGRVGDGKWGRGVASRPLACRLWVLVV